MDLVAGVIALSSPVIFPYDLWINSAANPVDKSSGACLTDKIMSVTKIALNATSPPWIQLRKIFLHLILDVHRSDNLDNQVACFGRDLDILLILCT